jgi:hypothetical protein
MIELQLGEAIPIAAAVAAGLLLCMALLMASARGPDLAAVDAAGKAVDE